MAFRTLPRRFFKFPGEKAREIVLELFESRFGEIPDALLERVKALPDESALKDLLRRAALIQQADQIWNNSANKATDV